MKLVYAGFKQMDKFNLCIPEMKYQQVKPKTVFETDDTNGNRIVKKYADVYKLAEYEAKYGPLAQAVEPEPVAETKEKKSFKNKMEVKVQADK